MKNTHFVTRQEILDCLLDAVNDGSLELIDGKFQQQWCSACRGSFRIHFCECGDEITTKTCQSFNGLCEDCYENSDYTPPQKTPIPLPSNA